MYLYFEACLKATWIHFGRAVLNEPSKTLPTEGILVYNQVTSSDLVMFTTAACPSDHNFLSSYLVYSGCNNPQGAASHDPCITEENVTKPPCHVTYLTDVASQLSDFTDDPVAQSKPIRSENDYDGE